MRTYKVSCSGDRLFDTVHLDLKVLSSKVALGRMKLKTIAAHYVKYGNILIAADFYDENDELVVKTDWDAVELIVFRNNHGVRWVDGESKHYLLVDNLNNSLDKE